MGADGLSLSLYKEMNIERTQLEFDEIHALVEESIRKAGSRMPDEVEDLEDTPEEDIIDDLFSVVVLAYTRGNRDANEMLGTRIPVDINRMNEAIYWVIGGKTFADRAREHIHDEDPGRLITLAESEYHRVYSAGGYDTANAAGKPVLKTWVTMLDDKVRETHDFLEGVTVPLNEKFNTIDGDSAYFPGGFSMAENNCNCRCLLQYTLA